MKKILFLAAAVLSLTACSNEEAFVGEKAPVTASKGTKLTFNFSLPQKAPVTYGIVPHTDAERKVERLDIYQFDAQSEDGQLEKIYPNLAYTREGTSDKYKSEVRVEEVGNKRFVLVTNNKSENPGYIAGIAHPAVKGVGVAGIKFSEFKKLTTATLTTIPLNGHSLVMTDYRDLPISANAPAPDVEAKLVRVMARIDIRNQDHNFKLKHVQLKKAKSQAYLLPEAKEGESPTSPTQLSTPAGTVDFPEVTLPQDASNSKIGFSNAGNVTTYQHVFYPYPSNTGTVLSEGPVIVLKGTLSESGKEDKEVAYEYQLKKDPSTYFGFKRNYVYTLVIKKAISEAQLDANFEVTRWHEDEIAAPVVQVTSARLVGAPSEPSVFNVDVEKKLITVEKAGGAVLLYLESNRALEAKLGTSAPWINDLRVVQSFTDNRRTKLSYIARFTVPANPDSEQRVAKLKIVNYLMPETFLLLDVVQKGS